MALAVAALSAAGCFEVFRGPNEADAPPGYVVYTVRPGDTAYTVAERAYGHGWMAGWIDKANGDYAKSSNYFKPGTKVLIPPDFGGHPVDPRSLASPFGRREG
jgi:nucleoid-associated protein YgaU